MEYLRNLGTGVSCFLSATNFTLSIFVAFVVKLLGACSTDRTILSLKFLAIHATNLKKNLLPKFYPVGHTFGCTPLNFNNSNLKWSIYRRIQFLSSLCWLNWSNGQPAEFDPFVDDIKMTNWVECRHFHFDHWSFYRLNRRQFIAKYCSEIEKNRTKISWKYRPLNIFLALRIRNKVAFFV